jgi:hypothetical protein
MGDSGLQPIEMSFPPSMIALRGIEAENDQP